MQQFITITLNDAGNVDIQVNPTNMTLEGYGTAIGTAVRLTANLFTSVEGIEPKDAIRALLKEVNKAAHSNDALRTHSTALN